MTFLSKSEVVLSVISSDQSGYLKGRFIGNYITSILDILDYSSVFNIEEIVVFVDFEKAF